MINPPSRTLLIKLQCLLVLHLRHQAAIQHSLLLDSDTNLMNVTGVGQTMYPYVVGYYRVHGQT